jgi:sugar/nucleoside kinase (ribokinase family)
MNPSPASAQNLPRRVLCLGDMAADIFAGPMARLPGPGEVRLTDRIAFFPGGNALNTAVALRRLGEQVSFVGSVGEDAFGDLLLAQLERIGLDLRGVSREPGGVTPTTLIYRAEGEDRRFIHALGMADRFTGHPVPLELIPEDGVMLAGGYLKLRAWKHEALRETLRLARQRRCTTMLNVCIPEGDRVEAGVCLRLLPDVDVFLPNEDEARVLTGHSDPADQARVFRDAGVGLAIITRGARGLYAADARHSIHMGVFSVPMVDPSGCGDCFSAGLIAARLRRWELVRSLKLASAVGALGATALGCTSGVPSFADAERFLLEHDAELPVEVQASR